MVFFTADHVQLVHDTRERKCVLCVRSDSERDQNAGATVAA